VGERVTKKHAGRRVLLKACRPPEREAAGLILGVRPHHFVFVEDGPEGLYQLATASWRVAEVLPGRLDVSSRARHV
jgi:hypothetical protein